MLDPIGWALVILDITESEGEQMSALARGEKFLLGMIDIGRKAAGIGPGADCPVLMLDLRKSDGLRRHRCDCKRQLFGRL